jgi:class 3 adenylate cyclase
MRPDDIAPDLEIDAGIARPGAFDLGAEMPRVQRTFAFLDLCRFTAYTDKHGEQAAGDELRRFRLLCRSVTSHRGVRIAKWLGDGVMLIGVDPGPTVAATVELVGRYTPLPLDLRAGVAAGGALMLDGDDYAGRPVNLAARLCLMASRNETLVCRSGLYDVPDWIHLTDSRPRRVRGLGRINDLARADLAPDIDLGPAVAVP